MRDEEILPNKPIPPDAGAPPYRHPQSEMQPARHPFRLPWRAWRRGLQRTAGQIGEDNLTIVSAGCAFFTLLAIFPAVTALVLLYGLSADPNAIAAHLTAIQEITPPEVYNLLEQEITRLAAQPSPGLGLSFLLSFSIALWSSTKAMRALMGALNIVYDEREKRGLLHLNLQIVAVTIGGIVSLVIAQIVISGIPPLLRSVGFGQSTELIISVLRWPFLGLILASGLALLYRLAPSRENARWLWALPGAILGTIGWIVASILFSLYVSFFGDYNALYGSFGAFVIMMLWLYWSFLIVLLGAELNAELEREVIRDTTTGPPEPLGMRGAEVADTVAE